MTLGSNFIACAALTALMAAACGPIVISDGNGNAQGASTPAATRRPCPNPF